MKKLLYVAVATFFALSFAACNDKEDVNNQDQQEQQQGGDDQQQGGDQQGEGEGEGEGGGEEQGGGEEIDYNALWNDGTSTGETDAYLNAFSVWYDQWWCGSNVALSNMSATATGCTATRTVEGNCWFGTQVWYAVSARCNMSFDIEMNVDGSITVNDNVYELEAGVAQTIEVDGANLNKKANDVEKYTLAILFGTEDPATTVPSCTFTISNFQIAE